MSPGLPIIIIMSLCGQFFLDRHLCMKNTAQSAKLKYSKFIRCVVSEGFVFSQMD